MNILNDRKWDLEKFTSKPRKYWNSKENQQKYLKELRLKIGIKKKEDWYRITKDQIIKYGGNYYSIYYYQLFLLCSV